jgi:hypothetical protein
MEEKRKNALEMEEKTPTQRKKKEKETSRQAVSSFHAFVLSHCMRKRSF